MPLSGDMALFVETPSGDHEVFWGNVTRAEPLADALQIHAESLVEMTEAKVGLLLSHGVSVQDELYRLFRQEGLELEISDVEDVPPEVFVIEMPITGISVEQVTSGWGIDFLPLATPLGEDDFGPFEPVRQDILTRWGRPSARARAYVPGLFMYDAEQTGIAHIQRCLDAVLATASYGFSRDPWGNALSFSRDRLRARPSALPVVFTQGSATGRRWIHDVDSVRTRPQVNAGSSMARWTEILTRLPDPEISHGLSALRDAADEARELVERCHAFCTALEYYAAPARPPAVVTKPAKSAVLAKLDEIEMSDLERARLREHIAQVNSPPLLARVRFQAGLDAAPLSDSEWALIKKLRTSRNRSVHGRVASDELTSDDLRLGTSIAARLLLHRWARESTSK